MINLDDNAKKSLDLYLQQVKSCLKDCSTVDAYEVEQSIIEHVESEFQGSSENISCDQLNTVLKKLGSPQQWIPDEEISWWRKIILRLHIGPEDWRLAYISFALLFLGFIVGRRYLITLIFASFIFSRASISAFDDTNLLKGRKWLIYPSLFIIYIFVAFFLFFWPIFPLAGLADVMENPRRFGFHDWNVFPWNTNDVDLAYWPIAVSFIISGVFLWWSILGYIHKKAPAILQIIFYPFAHRFKSTKWFTTISLALFALFFTSGILMTNYQGWYHFLKRLFQ
jgi:hypothetical protein